MDVSENGLNLIKEFEGFMAEAYLDAVSVPTIGFGTTMIDGKPVQLGMTCTEEEATQWLYADTASVVQDINVSLQVPVSQNQFDALVSFTYNLGIRNLRNSTLLRLLNAGNITAAANEFPKWDMAGGHVLQGLLRRRLAEQRLFLTPDAANQQ